MTWLNRLFADLHLTYACFNALRKSDEPDNMCRADLVGRAMTFAAQNIMQDRP